MQIRLLTLVTLLFSALVNADPVERVISLAPHATEIAYAAGLGDKLIAVSDHSDYPEEATKLEKVSNYQGIKLERIIALQPDLVIAWPAGNPAKELEKLKQFGINIYYSTTGSLDDIANNIEQLSQYSQDPYVGLNAAKQYRSRLATFKQRYQTDLPVRYFYQLSEQPIITVAKGNWPSEVFSFCGGENVFAKSAVPYPQVGTEQVVLSEPEVIFTSEHAIAKGSPWLDWKQQLSAVENGYVWSLNSDWLNRPTPRTLNAIKEVCEHFETVRRNR
ncbi:vitamin B12 ABC transporter substrate-binding protein BtuF [Vibrio neptunius]|uniref:vitamin B12 ABC transporter substrate-binding protein BtuF n=1 Tax=Vibrio neptunius TaxID=170651 RepID=UPI0019D2EC16|nr:vitamin B12 ABC transporter substrate-binding protein BtuF [Vibrio neptunius]MBN3574923.1 vitamin B12 ABC transporter substrate-binding protein BtuF [Vibrio neptunius]